MTKMDIDCGPYEHYNITFKDMIEATEFKIVIEHLIETSPSHGGFIKLPLDKTGKIRYVNVSKIISLTLQE